MRYMKRLPSLDFEREALLDREWEWERRPPPREERDLLARRPLLALLEERGCSLERPNAVRLFA